jgi:hypothetical protein
MVARTRLARCPNSQSSAAQDVRSLIAMSAIPVQKEGSLKSSVGNAGTMGRRFESLSNGHDE